jgi:hypothetical protein
MLHAAFLANMADRIVSIDTATYKLAGNILGRARLQRQGIKESHCLLAAAALRHELVLVTRNARDFAATGVDYLDTSKLPGATVIEADFRRKVPFALSVLTSRPKRADDANPERI